MKLGKPIKLLIGLGTVWVAIYPLLFLAAWLSMVIGMGWTAWASRGEPSAPPFFMTFFAIFPLHCLTIFMQLALEVFYLIHVIKNTTAAETPRIILGVGTFFMPFVAMPVYYYLYIWLNQPPEWALAQKQTTA